MKYLVKKNDKENYATNDNADEDYPKSIDRAVAIEQTEKGSGYCVFELVLQEPFVKPICHFLTKLLRQSDGIALN